AQQAEAAIAVPVFDSPEAPGSGGERRRRLLGWTVTTFAVAPLLDAVAARPRDAAVVSDGATVLGGLAEVGGARPAVGGRLAGAVPV
ncbi:hypothetical protein, partial [Cellulomonas sp. GbtcB1]|uniref:hypothetical protein n=1 Tax=Cellulomonas sp. GbtcB1 TaxID=2824746 RepID=UPI001C2F5EBC